jgi:lipoxygenase
MHAEHQYLFLGKKTACCSKHVSHPDVVMQALLQNRLYILDHHYYLMPYLKRINALGMCIYVSRTQAIYIYIYIYNM